MFGSEESTLVEVELHGIHFAVFGHMWHAIERFFLGTCDNWILAHTEMVLMLDVDFIGFLEISAPVGQVPSNSQIQLSDVTVPCYVVKKFYFFCSQMQ